MRKEGADNSVTLSRKAKAVMFKRAEPATVPMKELAAGIARVERQGKSAFGMYRVRAHQWRDRITPELEAAVVKAYPHIQFVDYTKSPQRALAHAAGKLPSQPPHYILIISGTNAADCERLVVAAGRQCGCGV